MNFEDYAINVSPLPAEEGRGFMASIPDLPGCIADGATIEGVSLNQLAATVLAEGLASR